MQNLLMNDEIVGKINAVICCEKVECFALIIDVNQSSITDAACEQRTTSFTDTHRTSAANDCIAFINMHYILSNL